MTVRLILGDQLNYKHSWFEEEESTKEDVCYFMAEMRQETDYVNHHIQKIIAFFDSMRNFADWLKAEGKKVIYYSLDNERNTQSLSKNLHQIIEELNANRFEYQLPDEYRLDEQLKDFCTTINIETKAFDTEHFLTSRSDLATFFEGKKRYTMEFFYRYMRRRYNIMMLTEKEPEGGKWNFDQSNRKKWTGSPAIPPAKHFHKNVSAIVKMITDAQVKTPTGKNVWLF